MIYRMENEKKPAVFLDRDGVLVEEKGYVSSEEEMNIFPYSMECIKKIKEMGYYAIVITNQSGVARGFFSEEKLKEMNAFLIKKLDLDALYYCPHHEKGSVLKYKCTCKCRKPGIGLIERACIDFNIDLKHSLFVGDRASDIQTGKNAKMKTILLESGYGTLHLEEMVSPDYIMNDLREVIKIL